MGHGLHLPPTAKDFRPCDFPPQCKGLLLAQLNHSGFKPQISIQPEYSPQSSPPKEHILPFPLQILHVWEIH